MVDLLEIADVCRRFNRIAKEVFEAKHSHFENFHNEMIMHYWPFEQFLKTFGQSIKSFGSAALFDNQCELAMKYCPNLIELKCNIRDQQNIDGLRNLIVQLVKLNIHLTDACMSIEDWFGADIKLQELTVEHSNTYFRLPKGKLPALKEFKMKGVRLVSGSEIFFRENEQLRRFSMSGWSEGKRPFDYSCFGALQNLEALEIRKGDGNCDATPVLMAMTDHGIPVEELMSNWRY